MTKLHVALDFEIADRQLLDELVKREKTSRAGLVVEATRAYMKRLQALHTYKDTGLDPQPGIFNFDD